MKSNNDSDLLLGLSGTFAALIGYSVIFLLPSFIETAAKNFSLSDQQIGWLGSTDTGGLALITLITAVFISRIDLRLISRIGIVIALAGNGLTLQAGDFSSLCIARFVAGLGEGLLVTAGIACLAQTQNPDRWFSIYTAAAVILQALGLYLFPYVVERWQLEGIVISFALLLILPLVFSPYLKAKSQLEAAVASPSSNSVLIMATASVMAFYISIGAVWTYVATMGTEAGFSFEWVSTALSISMIGGFIGAVGLALLGHLAKGFGVLLVSALLMLACLLVLARDFNPFQYQWALILYSVVWSVIAARLYSIIALADSSGRFITATQPVLNIGFALGPLLASLLVADFSYLGVIAVAVLALVVCLVLVGPLARQQGAV